MLVILSIAVVVLLAVVAFFMGAFGSTSGSMSRQARIDACCQGYVFNGGCNGNYDIVDVNTDDIDGVDDCSNIVTTPETQCCNDQQNNEE